MTEPCSCPMAGWCERHGIEKRQPHWQLCQTRENYRRAWDEQRLHGQRENGKEKPEAIKDKIRQRVLEKQRLIAWISFLRVPDDKGLGDATFRLIRAAKDKPELRDRLKKFLRLCGCDTGVAISQLNQQHPFPQSQPLPPQDSQ